MKRHIEWTSYSSFALNTWTTANRLLIHLGELTNSGAALGTAPIIGVSIKRDQICTTETALLTAGCKGQTGTKR